MEHVYHLSGKQIETEEWDIYLLVYLYDAEGSPIGMQYRTSAMTEGSFFTFWFEKNLQGDIVAVYNASGTKCLTYTYDAWGNVTATSVNTSGTNNFATYNPFRYRGYYYDTETGLYYLNSRYYDPATGRFINADGQLNDGLLGYNLFAYCENNPVNGIDSAGSFPTWLAITLGAVAAAAAVAATVVTFGAAAPAAVCTLTGMAMSIGASYAVASTVATAAVAVTAVATAAYAADIAYSTFTGDSPLLNTVFQGDEDAYNVGLAITSIATGMVLEAAAQSPGVCFVAGTLVSTQEGGIPIEIVKVGDYVWATDPETNKTELKQVCQTFVNETDSLVHITIGGEEIVTTPSHPFYVPIKGWTEACKLRAGDRLQLLNGEYVVIEQIQHELLELPVLVYNFEVEDFHTYYVSNLCVLVHNKCYNDSNNIENDVIDLPRTGSALKGDPYHSFPDVVDNYVNYATKTSISNGTLYQLLGSLNGIDGRFEWIVQDQQVVHRYFVEGGGINGIPILP